MNKITFQGLIQNSALEVSTVTFFHIKMTNSTAKSGKENGCSSVMKKLLLREK